MPRPRPIRPHPDLFAYREPQVPIASERAELLALLSTLLVETLVTIAAVEASDEDRG